MAKEFEMGDMPEMEKDELELEGMDYESDAPEAPVSPLEDMKASLADLSDEDLGELEAALADERALRSESDSEESADMMEAEAPEMA